MRVLAQDGVLESMSRVRVGYQSFEMDHVVGELVKQKYFALELAVVQQHLAVELTELEHFPLELAVMPDYFVLEYIQEDHVALESATVENLAL